jgi:pimeloyl-ACP methyl ester carboxylesterase
LYFSVPKSRVVPFVVFVAAVLATACDGGRPARELVAADREVAWRDCGDGFECATLVVPRDYGAPRGATIDVALIRQRATDPDARIGSLLVNPGGPGASGVEFVRSAAGLLPEALQARFDIVGFDPRGTGETIPIDCGVDLDPVFALDTSPDDAAERAEIEATYTELGRACENANGEDLAAVSSVETVRDMNRIRASVGDEQLTYLGYSYGTYLGALYADMFPARVRAMLLDGAVDPALDPADSTIEQAVGFERALDAFLDDCAGERECAFHSGGDPAAALDDLLAEIDEDGVPVSDGRTLGPGEADLAIAEALYFGEVEYATLARALAAVDDGDADPLLALSDRYTGRAEDGTYDDSKDAFWAISCRDSGFPATTDAALRALEARATAAAPHFGAASVYLGSVCSHWPVGPVAASGALHAQRAPPILVVGTTGDPATPVAWAESLADQLASGVLVVVEGTQHGAFGFEADPCIDDIGVAYLVDLDVPPPGTRCP